MASKLAARSEPTIMVRSAIASSRLGETNPDELMRLLAKH
jgi:hypothetical protein